MSVQLINQYIAKREKFIQFGGSKNELSFRGTFKDLLNYYAEKKNLLASMKLNLMRPIFQVVYTSTDFKQKISSALKKRY
jgi:hypothetical protein